MKQFLHLSLSGDEVAALIMITHQASQTTFMDAKTRAAVQQLGQKIYNKAGVDVDSTDLPLGDF
jgi:hypothetical protein